MKKLVVCSILLAFCCAPCLLTSAQAAEKGPAEMDLLATVDPTPTPKPAHFPHAEHQSRLECKTCHHGKDAAGKQVAYVDGQKIEKCETCHNTKSGMPEQLNTFKKAAHALCQNCHKKNNPNLAKCSVCHK